MGEFNDWLTLREHFHKVTSPESANQLRKLVGRDGKVHRNEDGELGVHTTAQNKGSGVVDHVAKWKDSLKKRGVVFKYDPPPPEERYSIHRYQDRGRRFED